MKRFTAFVFAFIAVFFLFGFVAEKRNKKKYRGYEKVDNGSYFLLVRKGTGVESVDSGGAVFVRIKFLTEADSAFIDINKELQRATYPMRIDRPKFKGDFLDLFMRLHTGDSARFFMRLDSLKKYFPNEFEFHDPRYDSMNYLGMAVAVDSIYTPAKVVALRAQQEAADRAEFERVQQVMLPLQAKAREREPFLVAHNDSLLKEYLAKNMTNVTPDINGIYYIEVNPGTGPTLYDTNLIVVRYTGTYLDGTIFDSNQLVPGQQPMAFRLGIDPMIEGWTYCMLRMRKGGKAIFILPPALAYSDGLTRIFEVEIVDVK